MPPLATFTISLLLGLDRLDVNNVTLLRLRGQPTTVCEEKQVRMLAGGLFYEN